MNSWISGARAAAAMIIGSAILLSGASCTKKAEKSDAKADTPAPEPKKENAGKLAEPGQSSQITVAGGVICIDTTAFADCAGASCVVDTKNEGQLLCDCEVASGPNWGKTRCAARVQTGTSLRAGFSPRQAGAPLFSKVLRCRRKSTWGSCVDAICEVNLKNPKTATCACTTTQEEPWGTLGGSCNLQNCEGMWSGFGLSQDVLYPMIAEFRRLNVPDKAIFTTCPVK